MIWIGLALGISLGAMLATVATAAILSVPSELRSGALGRRLAMVLPPLLSQARKSNYRGRYEDWEAMAATLDEIHELPEVET